MGDIEETQFTAKDCELAGREILEYIRCIVCSEPSDSSAVACDNGHLTCSVCQCKIIVLICQYCKDRVMAVHSLSRFLKNATFKLHCRNAKSGCSFFGTPLEFSEHQCKYRTVSCVMNKKCRDAGTSVDVGDLWKHFLENHVINQSISYPINPVNVKLSTIKEESETKGPASLLCVENRIGLVIEKDDRDIRFWMIDEALDGESSRKCTISVRLEGHSQFKASFEQMPVYSGRLHSLDEMEDSRSICTISLGIVEGASNSELGDEDPLLVFSWKIHE